MVTHQLDHPRAITSTLTIWSSVPGASSRHDATHSTEVLKPQRRIHREILRRLSISSPQGRLIWGYLRPRPRIVCSTFAKINMIKKPTSDFFPLNIYWVLWFYFAGDMFNNHICWRCTNQILYQENIIACWCRSIRALVNLI